MGVFLSIIRNIFKVKCLSEWAFHFSNHPTLCRGKIPSAFQIHFEFILPVLECRWAGDSQKKKA